MHPKYGLLIGYVDWHEIKDSKELIVNLQEQAFGWCKPHHNGITSTKRDEFDQVTYPGKFYTHDKLSEEINHWREQVDAASNNSLFTTFKNEPTSWLNPFGMNAAEADAANAKRKDSEKALQKAISDRLKMMA